MRRNYGQCNKGARREGAATELVSDSSSGRMLSWDERIMHGVARKAEHRRPADQTAGLIPATWARGLNRREGAPRVDDAAGSGDGVAASCSAAKAATRSVSDKGWLK